MRDFFGSDTAQPATIAPSIAAIVRGLKAQEPRSLIRVLTALAALLICCTHAAVAGANTVPAAGFGYLCLSLVMFGCAAGFWTRARSAHGTLYLRWLFISVAALAASIGYFPSSTQGFLNTTPARQFQTVCFNSSEALYMLATVLFFAGVARSIVIVDILQALMFTVLSFNLIYSPATRDHFSVYHLLIGQLIALFLFLVALVACLGAASHTELRFLRTLSCFLGVRLITFFLANQVSYVWFRYEHCSLWDVPGEALLAGFALYLLSTGRSDRGPQQQVLVAGVASDRGPQQQVLVAGVASDRGPQQQVLVAGVAVPLRSPSLVVRSLMPSFLALVNLMLGLFTLRISVPLAVAAISVSLVCYVARTVLLHAHAMREKASLESRNEQLEGLAVRDPLTGIGNRRSLAGAYSRLQALNGNETLSLLLMDIDYFKQANDRHGHLHGDKVLIALARKLESLASSVPGSHCARFGGDEFALLLLNVSPEKASTLAEELRALFSAHVFDTANGPVSLSMGVASLRAVRDLPLEGLISYADQALYSAKLLGRNRVEVQPVWRPGSAEDAISPALRMELQLSPAAD